MTFAVQSMPPGRAARSDAEIDSHIRDTAGTMFHPVGTFQMGTDHMAVVDPQLKVRGVEGLRVVDASVMPNLVSGNTNAATMMVANELLKSCCARYEQV